MFNTGKTFKFRKWHYPASWYHYNDVIMGMIASQITSLTIVYLTVYSDADQRKYQSSASLAFVRGIHRGPVNSLHKWPVTRKCFPFDDVIMPKQGLIQAIDSPRDDNEWDKYLPNTGANQAQRFITIDNDIPSQKQFAVHINDLFISSPISDLSHTLMIKQLWSKSNQNLTKEQKMIV